MKSAIDRPRPPGFFSDVVLRIDLPDAAGFPSAHTAMATGMALVVGWAWPQVRHVAMAVAVAVGLSRIHLGVHMPLDVLGGWALGVAGGVLAADAVERLGRAAGPDGWAHGRVRPPDAREAGPDR